MTVFTQNLLTFNLYCVSIILFVDSLIILILFCSYVFYLSCSVNNVFYLLCSLCFFVLCIVNNVFYLSCSLCLSFFAMTIQNHNNYFGFYLNFISTKVIQKLKKHIDIRKERSIYIKMARKVFIHKVIIFQ